MVQLFTVSSSSVVECEVLPENWKDYRIFRDEHSTYQLLLGRALLPMLLNRHLQNICFNVQSKV